MTAPRWLRRWWLQAQRRQCVAQSRQALLEGWWHKQAAESAAADAAKHTAAVRGIDAALAQLDLRRDSQALLRQAQQLIFHGARAVPKPEKHGRGWMLRLVGL